VSLRLCGRIFSSRKYLLISIRIRRQVMKKFFASLFWILILLTMLTQCASMGKGPYKRIVTINPPAPVDEYQVMIRLQKSNFNMKIVAADGSNIRFYDTLGNNLYFWIENLNVYGVSTFWVRVKTAGTDKIEIRSGEKGLETPGPDGTLVFDPVASWDNFKTNWFYSGVVEGRVSGWELRLTNYVFFTGDWKKADISSDYLDPADYCRWFVRKEFFIASGEVSFSGAAGSDIVWSAITPDEMYKKIGGDEKDADGVSSGAFTCRINVEKPFEHLIIAGRCQKITGENIFRITQVDTGLERMYTRK
jgi:hypothetical protein